MTSTEPLDSLEVATLNEHKKIRERLRLNGMTLEQQVPVLIDEVDRVGYLLQLEKISIAGGDTYHNKLIETQDVITAQKGVIHGLEDEVVRLRSVADGL
ncbi:hypothetical protein [Photobacterium carnosum]|uniref:hypothetical protein n=1 Tax=Photobacterium carnosum TaxID=2023717 RepID=UPI001E4704F6|nr:hypothetical protein [Photobacterium carnosum]MCD9498854.1 hypothetical protein [Photobacterium carnosum]